MLFTWASLDAASICQAGNFEIIAAVQDTGGKDLPMEGDLYLSALRRLGGEGEKSSYVLSEEE